MTIPDYRTIMLPLLRLLGDGRERSLAMTSYALLRIDSDYFTEE